MFALSIWGIARVTIEDLVAEFQIDDVEGSSKALLNAVFAYGGDGYPDP